MVMLELEKQLVGGILTLSVRGEVDSANAAELRAALRRVPAGKAVIVDLRGVPFMDSAGLGALICGIRELRFRGATVALCVRRGGVLRLLSVTGFDRIVPTARSLEEAQESIHEAKQTEAIESGAG